MKRESRFVNLQSAAKETIILVTVCAPSEGQSLHLHFHKDESGQRTGPESQLFWDLQPHPPNVPGGPSRADWSVTPQRQSLPGFHLACPTTRLLLKWILLSETLFFLPIILKL